MTLSIKTEKIIHMAPRPLSSSYINTEDTGEKGQVSEGRSGKTKASAFSIEENKE